MQQLQVEEDDWVATVYMDDWYIGQVKRIDEREVFIDFLEQHGHLRLEFRKPSRKDTLQVLFEDVLCVIEDPARKRGFKILEETKSNIESLFSVKNN